jgi:hypothetical protein
MAATSSVSSALSIFISVLIGLTPLTGTTQAQTAKKPPPGAAEPTPDLEQVLVRARTAIGLEALKSCSAGLVLEGDWAGYGLNGSYRLQFTPRGEFLQRIDCGVHDLVAFDGVTGWGVDPSGTPRILEMDDLEGAQTLMWVQTGRWLAADGPFTITVVAGACNNRTIRLHLQLKGGVKDAYLDVDRLTGLPVQLRRRWHVGDETWEFANYRITRGVALAHKIVHTTGADVGSCVIHTVRDVSPGGGDAYKPALVRPSDTRFNRAAPAAVPIKRDASGFLFVRPKIDGQDIGWFVLDTGTGAGMTIAAAVADKLHMPSFGKKAFVGTGKPEQPSAFRQGATFGLGRVTISGTVYLEMPPALVALLSKNSGLDVAGTCGYDLFSRATIVLEWKDEKLELHDPDNYHLAGARWLTLSLNHKIPCVRCGFNDREGVFRLDTGCPVILFHSPAVENLKLLEGRRTEPVTIAGAGAAVQGRVGTLESFAVAGHRFEKPRAVFTIGKEGALAEPYTIGTFGGQYLAPFQVVFDYPHRRIAFQEKR